jgi:uncharacterized membrane protein YqhA
MLNFSKILRLRYVFLVVSILSFLNALMFIGVGIAEAFHAYQILFAAIGGGPWDNPGVILIESLDKFLIAILFYIFGVGMIKLFLPELFEGMEIPKWLDVKGIRELKVLLWETILVTLVILCVTSMVTKTNSLTWDALIMPSIIAILAISLFFMQSKVNKGGDDH